MLLYQNVTITKRITFASTFTVLKHKLEYMTIKIGMSTTTYFLHYKRYLLVMTMFLFYNGTKYDSTIIS